MNINQLLCGIDCICGRRHTSDIQSVYVESGALSKLTSLCINYNKILIVADENTYRAAGEGISAALSDKKLKEVIFPGDSILIPDEKAIDTVNKNLSDTELIIGIGSGVIQDLSKYVSHFSKIPYMIVATAPSMDGYASSGAAMILNGMKETVSAGMPLAIIADVDVLKDAPLDMIKAGYGDVIGKFSALCDWKLAHAVNGEYFCDYIYSVTYKMIDETLKTAKGLCERNPESIKALMEALIIVGIMMSFAGSSRPASGSEHHLSHFFEIVGIVKGEKYFPHGIDVAYSTIETAKLRERLVNSEFPKTQYKKERADLEKKLREIYCSVADGCISLQDKAGSYECDRISTYKAKEKEIKDILKEPPTAKEIEDMLSLAEIDISEFYKLYGEKKIKDAVIYAKDLKDRYSVLWLNYDIFGEN